MQAIFPPIQQQISNDVPIILLWNLVADFYTIKNCLATKPTRAQLIDVYRQVPGAVCYWSNSTRKYLECNLVDVLDGGNAVVVSVLDACKDVPVENMGAFLHDVEKAPSTSV